MDSVDANFVKYPMGVRPLLVYYEWVPNGSHKFPILNREFSFPGIYGPTYNMLYTTSNDTFPMKMLLTEFFSLARPAEPFYFDDRPGLTILASILHSEP